MRLDGNEAKEVIQQAAGCVDRIERSWFPNCIHAGHASSLMITGNQLRQDLHRWLAPPDPSTNHNIACNAHHKGTATWFFEGSTYKDWKSTGSESLLWINGKRALLFHPAAPRHLIKILICSWLWQEHTLVRRDFTVLLTIIELLAFLQFDNHRRCANDVQSRSSLDGILLFRLPRHQQTTLA